MLSQCWQHKTTAWGEKIWRELTNSKVEFDLTTRYTPNLMTSSVAAYVTQEWCYGLHCVSQTWWHHQLLCTPRLMTSSVAMWPPECHIVGWRRRMQVVNSPRDYSPFPCDWDNMTVRWVETDLCRPSSEFELDVQTENRPNRPISNSA